MRAIARRIHRLEERLVPEEDSATQRAAEILLERMRRGCEARGEPFKEPALEPLPVVPGRRLSAAETLMLRLRQKRERRCAQQAREQAEKASDISC